MQDATAIIEQSSVPQVESGASFAVGDIIGRSFSILRRNFGQFAGIAALFLLPELILSVWLGDAKSSGRFATSAVSFIQSTLQTFAQAVIIRGAYNDIQGKPVKSFALISGTSGRFWPVFCVAFLQAVGTILGFLLLIVPGLLLLGMWYAAPAACVIENRKATDSLNRSAALTRGHRWKICAIFGVVAIGVVAIELAFESGAKAMGATASLPLIDYIFQTLTSPLMATLIAVVYTALRMAKEGAEPDRIAAVFE
jgi:hypothetical protein